VCIKQSALAALCCGRRRCLNQFTTRRPLAFRVLSSTRVINDRDLLAKPNSTLVPNNKINKQNLTAAAVVVVFKDKNKCKQCKKKE